MNKKENEIALDAIILAYGTLHYADISIDKTFEFSIKYLYDLFQQTEKKEYLHIALLHLRAFVRMGLDYEWHEELFDQIIDKLDIRKEDLFKEYVYSPKLIKLTRPQVRSMIGKWMPSASNPQKIGEVIDEIIEKVKNQVQGGYTWTYMRAGEKYIYELIVSPEQCFFHDVRLKKYYFFDLSGVINHGDARE